MALASNVQRATTTSDPWPARLDPLVLDSLAYPTPYLISDLDAVRDRIRRLRAALAGVRCHYAMKCNPAPQVLLAVADEGASFEIASAGELERLRALGIDVDGVLYSNPVKPPAHIEAARARGIEHFAFDGPGELRKLAELAPGANVYLRLRVDDVSSAFPLSRKFGADPADACDLLLEARRAGLRPHGLTFHVGSQCTDPDAWYRAISACGSIMGQLDERGIQLEMLDLGGGFPARYASGAATIEDIATVIRRALDDALPYVPPLLVVEPGRYVVAESAVMASTVIGRERRGDEDWLYLDVSAYHGMMESQQTGGRWDFPVRASLHVAAGSDGLAPFTVTGPTCDSSDTMFNRVLLPASIDVGDRVYIGSTGAYTASYATDFNGFLPPAAHFVGGV